MILTMTEAIKYCNENRPVGARWTNARRMLKFHLDNGNIEALDERQHGQIVRLSKADVDQLLAGQEKEPIDLGLVAELLKTMPIVAVAKRLGTTPQKIIDARRAAGALSYTGNKRQAALDALAKFHPQGLNDRQIAEKAGVSRELVSKLRREQNLVANGANANKSKDKSK